MNNLDEIKKRLAYAENNNLFQAHYINDMKWLIENLRIANQTISALRNQRAQEDEAIKA